MNGLCIIYPNLCTALVGGAAAGSSGNNSKDPKKTAGNKWQASSTAAANGSKGATKLYVLDEITRGLHHQDVTNVMKILRTVLEEHRGHEKVGFVLVEHNLQAISLCDYVIDVGPGAGRLGGEIVVSGPVSEVLQKNAGRSKTIAELQKAGFRG